MTLQVGIDKKTLIKKLGALPLSSLLVLASRAALRLFPMEKLMMTSAASEVLFREREWLKLFRRMSLVSAVAKYPDSNIIFSNLPKYITFGYMKSGEKHKNTAIYSIFQAALVRFSDSDAVSDSASSIAHFNLLGVILYILEEQAQVSLFAQALESDLSHFELSDELIHMSLWMSEIPSAVQKSWEERSEQLYRYSGNWTVWTRWYDELLLGGSTYGGEELDTFRALLDSEKSWELPVVDINELIRLKGEDIASRQFASTLPHVTGQTLNSNGISSAEEFGQASVSLSQPDHMQRIPENLSSIEDNISATDIIVPAQKPAIIETEIVEDVVVALHNIEISDVGADAQIAAFAVLKLSLEKFVVEAVTSNIDKRILRPFETAISILASGSPEHFEIYQLGHLQSEIAGFSFAANKEWPIVLSASYHATVLTFDRTLKQFPIWRDFKRNAAKQVFEESSIAKITEYLEPVIEQFETAESSEFIASEISSTLRRLNNNLADAIREKQQQAEISSKILEQATEELAYDLLESLSNTFKSIARLALKYSENYFGGVHSGVSEQLTETGKKHGARIVKWSIGYFVTSAAAHATGAPAFILDLAATYPQQLGWLTPVVNFLTRSLGL